MRNIHYSGATQLGCISVRENQPGVLMLFTDGMNSYGKKIPATNGALLFCINSSPKPDLTSLTNIVGNSGGSLIDLHRVGMATAIGRSSKVQNWLLDITSKTGKTIIEQAFPMKVGNSILIHGIAGNRTDTLLLNYGSSNQVLKVKEIVLAAGAACDEPLISRISVLDNFDKLIKSPLWDKILDAGLQENMVTPNTAYIVLERVED